MPKKSRSNSQQPKHAAGTQEDNPVEDIESKEQKFSLYLLLQIERNATHEQIKKQYRKLALKYHPDKNKQDPDAKQKFHKFKQAYDILSDPEKRKLYDQKGIVGSEEQFDEKSFQSAYEYFRAMFKKVTKQDIDDFEKRYRNGPMQEEDLLDFYQQHEGNMVQLIESIPLSTNNDIPRFIQFFEDQIKGKKISKYKSFDKTKNKVRHMKDETEEFQQTQKDKKKQEFQELALAIRQKRASHQVDFLAALQEKYGGAKKKKAQHKVEEEAVKKKKVRSKKEE